MSRGFARCLLITVFALAPSWATALPFARIIRMQPIVMVTRGGSVAPVAAQERLEIKPRDTIAVGKVGSAEVVFRSGTIIRMAPNSTIRGHFTDDAEHRLIIDVIGKLSRIFVSQRGSTQVRTGAATAASPGTEYTIETLADDSTVLTVIEGAVQFYNEHGAVTVRDKQQSTARPGQAPTPPTVVDISGVLEFSADTAPPAELETPFGAARPTGAILRDLGSAVRATPNDVAARIRYGEALYDSGSYAGAAEQLSESARLAPNNSMAHFGLAQALRGQGNLDAAVAEYKRALEIEPENVPARVGIALVEVARRDYKQARSLLASARQDAMVKSVEGLIELREGHSREALRALESATSEQPRLYQVQALLALARLLESDLPGALAASRRAVDLAPTSAQAHGIRALALLYAGKRDEAAREGAVAAQFDPLSPFALSAKGRTLLSQDRAGEALQAFKQAQALSPDVVPTYADLGAAYLRLGRPRDAEASYRRAITIAPRWTDAQVGLGIALQRQGRVQESIALYQGALQSQPSSVAAMENLAALHIEQGNLAEAERLLEQAVISRPDRGILYARLSEIALLRRQDLQAAERFARRAVELLPQSGTARYQLGRVYMEQGRLEQAKTELREAVTLDRQLADARYALGVVRAQTEIIDPAHPVFSMGDSAGLSRLISLMNLQAPGLNDRIEAATTDPTVARVATRAYGDTELEGAAGNLALRDFRVSHLTQSAGRDAVTGFTAAHQETDGIRQNADTSTERGGFLLGRKPSGNRLGGLLMGQFGSQIRGLNGQDIGGSPSTEIAIDETGIHQAPSTGLAVRSRTNTPFVLASLTREPDDRQRIKILGQWSEPRMSLSGLRNGATARQDSSIHGIEFRTDWRLGVNDLVTSGIAYANTRLNQSQQSGPSDPAPSFTADIRAGSFKAYVRRETAISSRLSVIGDIRYQHASATTDTVTLFGDPIPPANSHSKITADVVLGAFIASYRADARTRIRLRGRRFFGGLRDLELLVPTDELNENQPGTPDLAFLGTGTGWDLELTRTLRNSAFLRFGASYQTLKGTQDLLGGVYTRARVATADIEYDGSIGKWTTFFLRGQFNHLRAEVGPSFDFLPYAPRWLFDAGFSYVNREGWFFTPRIILRSSAPPLTLPMVLNGDIALVQYVQPGYCVLNLRLGRRMGLRSEAFVEITNLLDHHYDLYFPDLTQAGVAYRAGWIQRF